MIKVNAPTRKRNTPRGAAIGRLFQPELQNFELELLMMIFTGLGRKGMLFFVSHRIASRIHEISDLKKKLSCSVLGPNTRG